MSRTDLIADCFTIIRNAMMTKKDSVDLPASNTIRAI
ncbi:MAG: 30S ribosomal protein S8, partial [Candidatus Omnitrophota bacterium]